jgi:hypothetical protein
MAHPWMPRLRAGRGEVRECSVVAKMVVCSKEDTRSSAREAGGHKLKIVVMVSTLVRLQKQNG